MATGDDYIAMEKKQSEISESPSATVAAESSAVTVMSNLGVSNRASRDSKYHSTRAFGRSALKAERDDHNQSR
jgi:hypothetical protein